MASAEAELVQRYADLELDEEVSETGATTEEWLHLLDNTRNNAFSRANFEREVVRERAAIEAARWNWQMRCWFWLRLRFADICFGLATLDLPVLCVLEIVDRIYVISAEFVPMHLKWDVAKTVKHFLTDEEKELRV